MIYLVIWIHWFCDFVLQSDKMAKNKSSSLFWLTYHATTYLVAMMVLLYVIGLYLPLAHITWSVAVTYALVNGTAHCLVDFVTSKITKSLWKDGKVHEFFAVIGLDQALHLTMLLLTLPILENA